MPEALDLLTRGASLIAAKFGSTAFTIAGLGAVTAGNWNALGRTEHIEINGRRVNFSVLAEFPRSEFPDATQAQLLAIAGQIVIRAADGATFRIVGQVMVDELTVRIALDSVNK